MNTEATPQPITVSSLICHRDVSMALKCLSSLLANCHEPIQLQLHDDGSLQDEDIELLSQQLQSPVIIRKQTADEQMAQVLSKYPAAWKFRQDHVLAKKLLDCMQFGENELFAYCDTDIYFFRPFFNPFVLPDDETYALFLKDNIHPYSIRARDFFTASDIQIVQHVNAGMLCFQRSFYDLDLIEWFLTKSILHSKPYLVEQTLWALLGQKASCRLWEPSQLVFMDASVKLTKTVVAGHFVSPSRHLLEQYTKAGSLHLNDAPTQIKTIPSKLCRPLDYAWMAAKSEIMRKIEATKPQRAQQ